MSWTDRYVNPFTHLACVPSWFLRYQKCCESGIRVGRRKCSVGFPRHQGIHGNEAGQSLSFLKSISYSSDVLEGVAICAFLLSTISRFTETCHLEDLFEQVRGEIKSICSIFNYTKKTVTLCFFTTDTLFPAQSSCSPLHL